MRYRHAVALLAIAGSPFLSSCAGGSETGSNREISAAIESAWNGAALGLVTGEVRFIAGGMTGRTPEASKGEDAIAELPLYRAFAEKGFITISDERDLTGAFTGWNDWFQLTQAGVRRTAQVTLTETGRRGGDVKKVGDVEELFVRVGTAKIDEIVANDSLAFGANQYRVVQGTHTFDIPDDIAAAYSEARGDKLGRERRFKALLKYDPFEKKWAYLGADLGARSGSFATNHVDQALALLRLCGSLTC